MPSTPPSSHARRVELAPQAAPPLYLPKLSARLVPQATMLTPYEPVGACRRTSRFLKFAEHAGVL